MVSGGCRAVCERLPLRLPRDPSFGVGKALAGALRREAACPAEEPPAPRRVRPSPV